MEAFYEKRFLGIRIPRYAAPMTQIILVGFIMFLNPGMYNALSGLGGAGQVDATVQNHAGIGLHSAFAVFGLLAGTFHNVLCVYLYGHYSVHPSFPCAAG